MNTPEALSITVVEDGNQKKFLLPDSSLHVNLLAGTYGSYRGHKEVDTPFLVFRDGLFYDSGILEYLFGSDGYHVVSGLRRIETKDGLPMWLHAKWFEAGDVITFVRIVTPPAPKNEPVPNTSMAT